jgi:hypothetical protein
MDIRVKHLTNSLDSREDSSLNMEELNVNTTSLPNRV